MCSVLDLAVCQSFVNLSDVGELQMRKRWDPASLGESGQFGRLEMDQMLLILAADKGVT